MCVPHRRYNAEEKALILETAQQAQERTGQPVEEIPAQWAFPAATYYRWKNPRERGDWLTGRLCSVARLSSHPRRGGGEVTSGT